MKTNTGILNRETQVKAYQNCTGYCPECGSPMLFSKSGCLCRDTHDHKCSWSCGGCNPRDGACK